MNTITEPAREVPVVADVDVCVVGGGPAGVAAALAASREGARVLLIERYGFLGGMTTAGLIACFLGFCTESGERVIEGLPMLIAKRLQVLGGTPSKDAIQWNYLKVDVELYKYLLDRMMEETGVDVLLHSYVCSTVTDGGAIKAVIVENKSGRQAIQAKVFVDATGDGDVACFAGAPFTKGRKADGLTQSMGSFFFISSVKWKSPQEKTQAQKIMRQAITSGAIHAWADAVDEGEMILPHNLRMINTTRCKGDATNVFDLTRAEIQQRRDIHRIIQFWRENIPAMKDVHLVQTAPQIGIRETRQITGEYVLTGEDVVNSRDFDDGIARGTWFMDIHCPRGLTPSGFNHPYSHLCTTQCEMDDDCVMKSDYPSELRSEEKLWPKGRGYYLIPYRAIIAKNLRNLLVAGRCISADHYAMSSLRVMVTCMAVGESAGVAAGLAIRNKKDLRDVSIKLLRKRLQAHGAAV